MSALTFDREFLELPCWTVRRDGAPFASVIDSGEVFLVAVTTGEPRIFASAIDAQAWLFAVAAVPEPADEPEPDWRDGDAEHAAYWRGDLIPRSAA